MPLFILTIITVMALADIWCWWRSDRALRKLASARERKLWRGLVATLACLAIGGLLLIIASRVLPIALPRWFVSAVFVWHFLTLPILALPATFLAGAVSLFRRFRGRRVEPSGEGISRRAFFTRIAVAAPPIVTAIATVRSQAQLEEFRVRRIDVPLAALPADLDGLTIAHVSDAHVGIFTRSAVLERIVETVNSLRADLVLQTGDLINNSVHDLPIALHMSRRFDSRLGQFIVEGNHDLFQGRRAFERGIREAGLPLLLNEAESLTIRGVPVRILGLRWGFVAADEPITDARPRGSGGDSAIAASMQQLRDKTNSGDPEAFDILLAHHPHAFDAAAEAGIPLTLAGHTHGGQLHLTESIGFGPAMFRYWSGLYRKTETGPALVVSNGVGNWFPLRVNAPAEIVHLTLRRA